MCCKYALIIYWVEKIAHFSFLRTLVNYQELTSYFIVKELEGLKKFRRFENRGNKLIDWNLIGICGMFDFGEQSLPVIKATLKW